MSGFVVSYERKLSDGNFGSEGLTLSWSWQDDEVDDVDDGQVTEQLETASQFLRTLVLTELSKSAAERVRFVANHELRAREVKVSVEPMSELEPDLEDLPF
jgi:hypothetical protein